MAKNTPTPAPLTRDGAVRYGQRGFTGASSVNPGKFVASEMADELRAKSGLDAVIAKGVRIDHIIDHPTGETTGRGAGVLAEGTGDPRLDAAFLAKQDRGGKSRGAVAAGNKNPNTGGAPSGTVPPNGRPVTTRG